MKLSLIILFLFISCSHNRTSFESYPTKSEVSVIEKDGSIKSLGQTPLVIDNDKLFHNEMVHIVFSHKEYEDKNFVLVRPEGNMRMNVSAKLKKEYKEDTNFMAQIDKVSSEVAKIQNNINIKNYENAKLMAKRLITTYPELSVAYDLLANIHFLQNNKKRALYYYRKADELSPNNFKRKKIMRKISGEF